MASTSPNGGAIEQFEESTESSREQHEAGVATVDSLAQPVPIDLDVQRRRSGGR